MDEERELFTEIRRLPVELAPAKEVISLYAGEWPSPFEGKGFEPLRFRDFELGDNPRRVHLPSSARRGTPTVVERVALRDMKLVIVVDLSPSMLVREKLRIQLQAASMILYSALQLESPFGLVVQCGGEQRSFGFGIGQKHFHRLYRLFWEISCGDESWQKGRRTRLSRFMPPRSMLIYFSDFLDEQGSLVDMTRLFTDVRRYDFVPVIVQDALETTFPQIPGGSLVPFSNPETGELQELWVTEKKAREIRALHEERFCELQYALRKIGGGFIHLDEADIQKTWERFRAFFQGRKAR